MGADGTALVETRLLLGPPDATSPHAPRNCPLCGRTGQSQRSAGSQRTYECGAGYCRAPGSERWESRGSCRRASRALRYAAVIAWLKRREVKACRRARLSSGCWRWPYHTACFVWPVACRFPRAPPAAGSADNGGPIAAWNQPRGRLASSDAGPSRAVNHVPGCSLVC